MGKQRWVCVWIVLRFNVFCYFNNTRTSKTYANLQSRMFCSLAAIDIKIIVGSFKYTTVPFIVWIKIDWTKLKNTISVKMAICTFQAREALIWPVFVTQLINFLFFSQFLPKLFLNRIKQHNLNEKNINATTANSNRFEMYDMVWSKKIHFHKVGSWASGFEATVSGPEIFSMKINHRECNILQLIQLDHQKSPPPPPLKKDFFFDYLW